MTWIDWLIVLVPLLVVGFIGWRAQKHVRAVSDFLAGGRVAGRYLVSVAQGEAGMGLISVVALFEMYYKSGFAIGFWQAIGTPVALVMTLTGFAVYRFRETRAMTLSQFFEARYSRSFRVFAGLLAWFSGVLNYALFPAVGGRFLVYFCDLPLEVEFLGMQWPTFGLVMAAFLTIAVVVVLAGGQLTAMVTDCVGGLFSYPMYVAIVIAILYKFSWGEMETALLSRPPGQSMLDPFDTHDLTEFNIFYIIVGIISSVYNRLSWQGCAAFNAAAASPHEQKMGGVLGAWRSGYSFLMIILLAVAGLTYLNHPDFASGAAAVHQELEARINLGTEESTAAAVTISEGQSAVETTGVAMDKPKPNATTLQIRSQMLVPVAVRHFLPVGVLGAFCAVMVFHLIATDTSYLHSWGSILVQDIVLPLRGKPFTPRVQMWLLRLSIASVALFAFFFSLFYKQVSDILMFFALTGSIYLGGAGAVILGGLYWKRGTAAGAWATLSIGSLLGLSGFLVTQFWADPIYPYLAHHAPDFLNVFANLLESLGDFLPLVAWKMSPTRFPITGQEILFITMVSSVAVYVVVSLLTCKEPFNLDRMLHRGQYSRAEDQGNAALGSTRKRGGFSSIFLGWDNQFTRSDKILSASVFIWSMANFAVWLIVVAWNSVSPFSKEAWADYFYIMNVLVVLAIGAVTTVWFTIGGTWDLHRLFKRLKTLERNVLDDGRVMGHVNAEDLAFVPEVSPDQLPPDQLPQAPAADQTPPRRP
jgi:SSS family solute:Na+ symporter